MKRTNAFLVHLVLFHCWTNQV